MDDSFVPSGFLDEDGDPVPATTNNPTGMLMDRMFDEDEVLEFLREGERQRSAWEPRLWSSSTATSSALEGARASVEITASDLTVSPSTAVVGREVTITGSGFTGDVESIHVGDAPVCTDIEDCDIEVASGGRVVAAFDIPNNEALADADDYQIMLVDSDGRIGTGMVTVPERTLTVDPGESRIGTPIDISGTGWPTGVGANLVAIYYGGLQYATAISTADGRWSASLDVPVTAQVGQTNTVEARATVGGEKALRNPNNVTQEEDHKTPDPVVALSSGQAQRGTTITVSGDNFDIFQPVMIEIADSDGHSVWDDHRRHRQLQHRRCCGAGAYSGQ